MHARAIPRYVLILVPVCLSLGIALAGGCKAKTVPANGIGGDGFGGDLPAVGVGLGHTVSSVTAGTLASTSTGMGGATSADVSVSGSGSGGAEVTTGTQAGTSTGSGSTTTGTPTSSTVGSSTTSTASSTATASSASSAAVSSSSSSATGGGQCTCGVENCSRSGCMEVCNNGWDDDADGKTDCDDPDCSSSVFCPIGWTCTFDLYYEGTCDCGCGAFDPDCSGTTPDYCMGCGDTGSCANGTCSNVDPEDNSHCFF
jgi:hypothetical protein